MYFSCWRRPTIVPPATFAYSANSWTDPSEKSPLATNSSHRFRGIKQSLANWSASISSFGSILPLSRSIITRFGSCRSTWAASWKKLNQQESVHVVRRLNWIRALVGVIHLARPNTPAFGIGRTNSTTTPAAAQFCLIDSANSFGWV